MSLVPRLGEPGNKTNYAPDSVSPESKASTETKSEACYHCNWDIMMLVDMKISETTKL